jgi:hypothetical protein
MEHTRKPGVSHSASLSPHTRRVTLVPLDTLKSRTMGTHISASSPTSDPIRDPNASADLSHHTPMMQRR